MICYEIIKQPIITESSMKLVQEQNSYTFKVDNKANKVEIKKAIETIYKVTVLSVRTVNVHPKPKTMGRHSGYKSAYKKAIIQLKKGQKIDGFEA